MMSAGRELLRRPCQRGKQRQKRRMRSATGVEGKCYMDVLVTSTRYALRTPSGIWPRQLGIRRSSAVGVTEALAGGDGVADDLLELLDVGEAPAVVAGPEHGRADAHLEYAAGAGLARDRADLRVDRRQHHPRHPPCPPQPPP